MFSLDDLKDFFSTRGYDVDVSSEPVAQRRFASDEEQQQVITRLKKLGVDPSGYEDTGWLYSWVVKAMPSAKTSRTTYRYEELQSEPC
jgi:hypothetical protein